MFERKTNEMIFITVKMIHFRLYELRPIYINHKTKIVRETNEVMSFHSYSTVKKFLSEAGFLKSTRLEDDKPDILEYWV